MPALSMRGRYLMREYFADSDLFRKLDATEREVMVGLWMLADDAGFLPRDIPAIAAAIYRYDAPEARESRIRAAIDRLKAIGKAESLRCCLRMPSVEAYPRAGTKSYEHRDQHRKHVSNVKRPNASRVESSPDGGETTPSPDPTLPVPSPTDPVVAGARAKAPRSPRGGPMSTAAEAAGGFVAELAARRSS